MNRLLKLAGRGVVVVIARVVGAEMVYGNLASESVSAAIHHYSTEEVHDEELSALRG